MIFTFFPFQFPERRKMIMCHNLLVLPVVAARTSLQSFSQWESFSTARDDSMWPSVSWISEHSFRSVSRSSMPNRTPSRPVSVMFRSEPGENSTMKESQGLAELQWRNRMLSSGSQFVLTDCSAFAVAWSPCKAHCILADLCCLSLGELSQAGHSSTTQQQVRAA